MEGTAPPNNPAMMPIVFRGLCSDIAPREGRIVP
jgi:hypothetical protein